MKSILSFILSIIFVFLTYVIKESVSTEFFKKDVCKVYSKEKSNANKCNYAIKDNQLNKDCLYNALNDLNKIISFRFSEQKKLTCELFSNVYLNDYYNKEIIKNIALSIKINTLYNKKEIQDDG